tara:strand:+ start:10129 stop:10971 length:843 start_codon:yes stop_codon:yes gene_type:complete
MENDFDYIDGEKFENLADVSFGDAHTEAKDIKIQDSIASIDGCPLVFCGTDRIGEFFDKLNGCDKVFDLISHNGDRNFSIEDLKRKPKNIRRWYSQNMMCSNEKVFPLPIGLERVFWSKKFYGSVGYKNKCIYGHKDVEFKKNKLLYVNFSIRPNRKKRQRSFDLFRGKGYATVDMGAANRDYNKYIRSIKESKFVLSPEGHGLDCHRTWEVLYSGSIPVLEKNSYYASLYSDLPVLMVGDFAEITEKFLQEKHESIVSSKWNMEKLKFSYWEDIIKKDR